MPMTAQEAVLTFLGFTTADRENQYTIHITDDVPSSCVVLDPSTNEYHVYFKETHLRYQPESALGVILHELRHTLGEGKRMMKMMYKEERALFEEPLAGFVNNVVEDNNIDRAGVPNFTRSSVLQQSAVEGVSATEVAGICEQLKSSEKLAEVEKTVLPLFMLAYNARLQWHSRGTLHIRGLLEIITSSFPTAYETYKERLVPLLDETASVKKRAEDTFECTRKILRALGFDPPPPGSSDGGEEDDGEGEGKGGEGTSFGMGELDDKTKELLKELAKALGIEEHTDKDHNEELLSKCKGLKDKGTHTFPPLGVVTEKTVWKDRDSPSSSVHSILSKMNRGRLRELQKFLSAMKDSRLDSGKWSGKMKPGSIAKFKKLQAPLYKRTMPDIVVDSAVYLLIDTSGSMQGREYNLACAGAIALAEAVRINGVSCEIAGFTSHSSKYWQYIFKGFQENVSRNIIINRMDSVRLSENDDDVNLLHTYYKLVCRPERNKILIVLSDGHPCGIRGGNSAAALKTVTSFVESDPNVHLIGIGIESSAVERYYKNRVVVNNATELPNKIMDVFTSTFQSLYKNRGNF